MLYLQCLRQLDCRFPQRTSYKTRRTNSSMTNQSWQSQWLVWDEIRRCDVPSPDIRVTEPCVVSAYSLCYYLYLVTAGLNINLPSSSYWYISFAKVRVKSLLAVYANRMDCWPLITKCLSHERESNTNTISSPEAEKMQPHYCTQRRVLMSK